MQQTVLYASHAASGAKFIDFSGWEMPIHYGSQLKEHLYVREDAGIFDVSHMRVVDIEGRDARAFLMRLLANSVAKLIEPGKALYTCMLNEAGCILDDLIVYYQTGEKYRLVINCATAEGDISWMQQQAHPFQVTVRPKPTLAILAVQGPEARNKANQVLKSFLSTEAFSALQQLKKFHSVSDGEWMIARTGYTGEDGYELIVPQSSAVDLWQQLLNQAIHPCGLGARDTLRLEAGLNLYGLDMDDTVTPWESNLAWTINLEDPARDFVGKSALIQQQQHGITRKLVGVVLKDKGVLRPHQPVIVPGIGEGTLTSGSYSPTLKCSIGLARLPVETVGYCEIVIRDKSHGAKVISPPFVRNGVRCFSMD